MSKSTLHVSPWNLNTCVDMICICVHLGMFGGFNWMHTFAACVLWDLSPLCWLCSFQPFMVLYGSLATGLYES